MRTSPEPNSSERILSHGGKRTASDYGTGEASWTRRHEPDELVNTALQWVFRQGDRCEQRNGRSRHDTNVAELNRSFTRRAQSQFAAGPMHNVTQTVS